MLEEARHCAARRAVAIAAAFGWALSGAASAGAPLPWQPGVETRDAIERLVDEAGLALPSTHWPLPLAAVEEALDALASSLPAALDAERRTVRAALARAGQPQWQVGVGPAQRPPAGYGADGRPGASVALRTAAASAGPFAARLGVRLGEEDGRTTRDADGSTLAMRAGPVVLAASAGSRWWGPGWQSSLILGHNAPALRALSVQRASVRPPASRWLAWIGPWTGEFFVAWPREAQGLKLIGQRVTLRPSGRLEIGLSRVIQWGGEHHPEDARSLLQALVGSGMNRERGERADDPGNALAGIDLRWRLPVRPRVTAYTQWIGEDESGGLPSRHIALAGVSYADASGMHRLFVEWAETTCGAPLDRDPVPGCAYRNSGYASGYTHAGRWLGAAVGPDARLATVGWVDRRHAVDVRLHLGTVGSRIGRTAAFGDRSDAGPYAALAGGRRFMLGPLSLSLSVELARQRTGAGIRLDRGIRATLSSDPFAGW